MIKRCNKLLNDYEEKLHLVEKFLITKEKVSEIHRLTNEYMNSGNMQLIYRIEKISSEFIDL